MPSPLDLPEAERKYKRNLSHVKLTKQLRAIESEVWDKGAVAQATLELNTVKVKNLLDQIGVYADYHPSYLAYALALNRTQRDMEFRVDRIREHAILRDRWIRRGLNTTILDALDDLLITDRP